MILLIAILVGWLAGYLYTRLSKQPWILPRLRYPWLVFLAFLPQFFAFFLPATRAGIPDSWAAACLVASDVLFLPFCWFNRRLAGIWLLAGGTLLNLVVILANGGFMPISPQTASHLIPASVLEAQPLGERFGLGKDILLLPEDTRLPWLSDILLLPGWVANQVAFSLGDVFVAVGAFWFMATRGMPLLNLTNKTEERK